MERNVLFVTSFLLKDFKPGFFFSGVLALQLLPRNSSLKIVVITDGMIAAPDINALENLLAQLRKDTIALSFIKLSSTFHPHSNLARQAL